MSVRNQIKAVKIFIKVLLVIPVKILCLTKACVAISLYKSRSVIVDQPILIQLNMTIIYILCV